jgi:intracellular sulfur oxidation DsrE/DsrF family protein
MKGLKKVIMTVCVFAIASQSALAQNNLQWETPLIKGYGPIKDYKNAAIQPDKNLDYKVVFKITSAKTKDGVNNKLWHMARLMNLLYVGNITKSNTHIIGVIAGKATSMVLTNAAYKKRFHKDNPNLKILQELTEHGAKIYVCDQALSEHKIRQHETNKFIKKSLSAIIDIPTYVLKGYALLP